MYRPIFLLTLPNRIKRKIFKPLKTLSEFWNKNENSIKIQSRNTPVS